jgi:hypothetical protein
MKESLKNNTSLLLQLPQYSGEIEKRKEFINEAKKKI